MARVPKPSVRAFVHEYVWGEFAGNATESVKRAGLCKSKRKSQKEYGCRLLRKPQVRELVDAQLAEKEALLKQSAVRVAEETHRLAIADIGQVFDKDGWPHGLEKMPEDVRRAISSIEVEYLEKVVEANDGTCIVRVPRVAKVKLHDKKAAQELFLKFAGKLKDRVELEGSFKLADLVPGLEKHDHAGAAAGQGEDADRGDEAPSPR